MSTQVTSSPAPADEKVVEPQDKAQDKVSVPLPPKESRPARQAIEAPTQRKKSRGRGRLEKVFGMFHCRDCDHRWASGFVFKLRNTYKVVYRQKCMMCDRFRFPWVTYPRICPDCEETYCICSDYEEGREKQLSTDNKKPHRSDLCEKCLKGHPCRGNIVPEE